MGKGPGAFSEIGKKAKDVLFKDYFYDQKVTFASTTDSGLKFNAVSVKKGEDVISDLKTELKLSDNVSTEIKVDTKAKIHARAEFEHLTPGLKLALSGVFPDFKSTKLDLTYKQDMLHATSSIGIAAQPVLEGTVASGAHGLVAGAEAGYDTATHTTTKYNFALGYSEKDYSAALVLTDKADTLKASFYQKVKDSDLAVAVELAHKLSKKDTTFTAGALYKVDRLTDSKFRINNRGVIAALLQHEFRPKSTITLSAEVDSKALDKGSKVGVNIALKV